MFLSVNEKSINHIITMTHKRMKRLMLTALAGMLLVGFSSCSQEMTRKGEPQVVDELVSPSLDGITFSLQFSGQDPKMVDTRAIHDNAEWDIKDLQVFVFDRDNNFLKRVVVERGTGNGKLEVGGADAKYTYPLADGLSDYPVANSIRQFFFLANGAPIEDLDATSTLQDLETRVFDAQQKADPKSILTTKTGVDYIPMTGMATSEKGSTLIPYSKGMQATVFLTRVVARIDIVNRIPDLRITEITLHNTFLKSRVSASDAEVERFAEPVQPYASLAGGLVGDRTPEGARLKKAFYLYEGKNLDAGGKCVYVRIKGELTKGGTKTTYFYNIPFKKKDLGSAGFGTVVDVKRNHLYTIVLGSDKNKGRIDFAFVDEDWDMLTFYEQFTPIKGELQTAGTTPGVTYKTTGVNTGEVSFAKDASTAVLKLSSILKNHTGFTLTPVAPISFLNGTALSGVGKEVTLTIKASANTAPGAEPRDGEVVVKSNVAGQEITIVVKQKNV